MKAYINTGVYTHVQLSDNTKLSLHLKSHSLAHPLFSLLTASVHPRYERCYNASRFMKKKKQDV